MNLLFLDTETTGLNKEDRLIQLAFKIKNNKKLINDLESYYFKPPVSISFDSMSVHHITNEMLESALFFKDSSLKARFIEMQHNCIVVAHNAPFDVGMLEKEGINFKVWIDTKRVAMNYIDSDSYKLQYLRYSLGLNNGEMAHDAAGDVLVLEKLFDLLYQKVQDEILTSDYQKIIDRMVTVSNNPVALKRLNFGKYFGKTFQDVTENARDYLVWLYNSEMSKIESERNEDLVYTLKLYLNS